MTPASNGLRGIGVTQMTVGSIIGLLGLFNFLYWNPANRCIETPKDCTLTDYQSLALNIVVMVSGVFMGVSGVCLGSRKNLKQENIIQLTDEQIQQGTEKIQAFIQSIQSEGAINLDRLTDRDKKTLKVLCAAVWEDLEDVI